MMSALASSALISVASLASVVMTGSAGRPWRHRQPPRSNSVRNWRIRSLDELAAQVLEVERRRPRQVPVGRRRHRVGRGRGRGPGR